MLVGDNSLVEDLRVLTSIELFLHADYYCKHPCFVSLYNQHKGNFFHSFRNLLALSVSHVSIDTDMQEENLVQAEAIYNCRSKFQWCGLLCILALSSVVRRPIRTFYPDFGLLKYKLLFNQSIQSRVEFPSVHVSSSVISLLFCKLGNLVLGHSFHHNHYVPIVYGPVPLGKRKYSGKDFEKNKKTCTSTSYKRVQSKINFTPLVSSFGGKQSLSSSVCQPPTFILPKPNDTITLFKTVPLMNKVCTGIKEDVTESQLILPHVFVGDKKQSICSSNNGTAVLSEPVFTVSSSLYKTGTVSSSSLGVRSATKTIQNSLTAVPLVENSDEDSVLHVDKTDIGHFRKLVKGMDTSDLFVLIQKMFVPDKKFLFPKSIISNQFRSFQHKWLQEYSWLAYSKSDDGAYCLPCVLFGDRFPNYSKVSRLFSEPFQHWNSAVYRFNQHAKNSFHQSTSLAYTSLQSQLAGKTRAIDVLINTELNKRIAENRKFLVPIIDTVLLSGRLNIPFRGHRDDFKYHPEVGEFSSQGVGNFISLLNYRVRGGDEVLREHLSNCKRNASYISKSSQNDIITACGEVISDEILSELKKNKFYSIIADEASDSSNKEQMSLVLRFVDSECNVREEFIRFIHCSQGLAGKDLFAILMKCLTDDLKLDIKNCRGQGYDGAGAVAGKNNGLCAHILRLCSKALFFHCHCHRLNLCIAHSCTIQPVRNVLEQIKELCYFFNGSQSREQMLANNLPSNSGKHKLKDVCRTRWVERIDGLDRFEEWFPAICCTLEEMKLNVSKNCNADTSSKAGCFFHCIVNFDFIVALVIVRNIFDATLPVTKLLQSKISDIVEGVALVNSLKNLSVAMRNNVDAYHEKWYKLSPSLAEKVNVVETRPRVCNRQVYRSNVPCESTSEYYKRSITIPLLDHLVDDLMTRFAPSAIAVYDGLAIIPCNVVSTKKLNWRAQFKSFAEFYAEDFPDLFSIDAELDLWEKHWLNFKDSIPDNITSTLKLINFPGFEYIKVGLTLLATIPLTSCECERSFSTLRRLKNYTRSTMVSERLNGLALMHIHQEIIPSIDAVINKFAEKNRRLEFT